ncbi:MAG: hypothetical protein A3I65_03310 [Betaproteobacteria bacterium RIFCSPLOWO2_02_FULL_68_150]|nr:MAG: hypothetical protein A3I65_03310 [Betaproteobacteria bacterium RIFCSPLOWO2_02_FULL_68_150]
MQPARLAADIGGTFTDVVLEHAGRRISAKVLTTPQAPEEGMLEGIVQVLAGAGLAATDVGVLIHGTTLATNALIERAGARTAFVTTSGFRDVLEMGYEKRYEHYDLNLELPAPLVPRALRFPVSERITARGAIDTPLDEAALDRVADALRQANVEAVAVGFLHAYANDAHERRAGEILAARLPGIAITLSSAVCPEIREYERFSTACAILSAGIARESGIAEVLSFDMGGTTAKICFISDGRPEQSRKFEVARVWRNLKGSGLPVRVPVTEMVEIGAGGGSIARLDSLGRIRVGPQSAGAEPGPACYRRGGSEPTVTDADVVLGRIDPQAFANGTLALDRAAAERAVRERIGERLALDAHWAAAGIGEIVEENMASAARVHAIERGKAAERCTMIAFGGAAPLHAVRLAAKLGMQRVLVPVDASVGSAVGFLRAPMAFELARSFALREESFDPAAINRLLEAMQAEAAAIVAAGAPGAVLETRRLVEMRHLGQGHEMAVPLPARALVQDDCAALRAAYQARYEEQFGVRIADVPLEFLTWSVTVATALAEASPPPAPAPAALRDAPPRGRRDVFDPALGKTELLPAYDRTDLAPGARLAGPALVTEPQTTTLLPAGWNLEVTAAGHLLLERR